MIDIKTIAKKKSTASGTSSSGSTLINGTISEAVHATRADKATRADAADQATYAQQSGTAKNAAYATTAGDLSADSPVMDKFLRKDIDDTASGIITLKKGTRLGVGDYGLSEEGAANLESLIIGKGAEQYGITNSGQATLSSAIVDQIHDSNRNESKRTLVGAEGFEYYMDSSGKSHLWVDTLSVRMKAVFAQLEIRKISYSGGTTIFSNAGSTLSKVATICDKDGNVIAYKCYATADDGTTATMNYWKVGMMAMCKTFNVKAGVYKDVSNRYYWRMVIGVGQETLTDGKIYDYVILSNVAQFGGSDIVPSYGEKILADENGTPLGWPTTMLAIVGNAETSVASIMADESVTKDDGGVAISTKVFYGYDPTIDNDAPSQGDVIVQVGDQIRYNQYGNMVMIETSAMDGSSDSNTVPAIAMYHQMGASWSTSDGGVNPYQWKRKTFVASPESVYINSNNFHWLTDDGEVIKPIIVQYDIQPSSTSLSIVSMAFQYHSNPIVVSLLKEPSLFTGIHFHCIPSHFIHFVLHSHPSRFTFVQHFVLRIIVPSKVRELTEKVCSFLNAAGVYLLIGVNDNNEIVGAEIDNSKRSAIQELIG